MSASIMPSVARAPESTVTRARSSSNPERRIADLAQDLAVKVRDAVEQIEAINVESRMLSLNAQIEAARSKAAGVAFGVVASAMRKLSGATADVARRVSEDTGNMIDELTHISQSLATNVRGTRLADLALTNIDLIDRNLYERSCDCRWWATDSSFVDALSQNNSGAFQYASQRMSVILKAYTVYFDLVLADINGKIVANGRPEMYRSVGTNQSKAEWFTSAMNTRNGDEFGFHRLHESTVVNGERALIYSAGVRQGGETNGKLLGALGIVFRWDALAQTIVENAPLSESEKKQTRVCIVDGNGLILADSWNRQLRESLRFAGLTELMQREKHFATLTISDRKYCVAHARSKGFETYATGWHSLMIQECD